MIFKDNKKIHVEAVKRTKVDTTYEYVPIIGEILGYWRGKSKYRSGDRIELHINTPLEYYDLLVINGQEIEIPKGVK